MGQSTVKAIAEDVEAADMSVLFREFNKGESTMNAGQGDLLSQLSEAIAIGAEPLALILIRQALREGIKPLEIINRALQPGLDIVDQRFDNGSCFVPELIMAGRIVQSAMRILDGELQRSKETRPSEGKVIIGTVAGDVHTIGKDQVATMLRINGFEVIDMGFNVPATAFINRIQEENAFILALSSLLPSTRYVQRDTIQELEKAGLRHQVKVIVGGASTTAEWAQRIGADGHAEDATRAVCVFRNLLATV